MISCNNATFELTAELKNTISLNFDSAMYQTIAVKYFKRTDFTE